MTSVILDLNSKFSVYDCIVSSLIKLNYDLLDLKVTWQVHHNKPFSSLGLEIYFSYQLRITPGPLDKSRLRLHPGLGNLGGYRLFSSLYSLDKNGMRTSETAAGTRRAGIH